MGILDQIIAGISPRWAASRSRDKIAAAFAGKQLRQYEGASKGRRTGGWKSQATSANAETALGAARVRDVARDLERNNGWAAKGVEAITSSAIGTGIRCQPKGPNKKAVDKIGALWLEWAETTACDFDGRLDFYGLQALAMDTIARDGEVIARWRKLPSIYKVPVAIQLLEPDFLDTARKVGEGKNEVLQGVEVDAEGREVAIWVYEKHPGDGGNVKSNRVPAGEYSRVYRVKRAGQLRGVSWFAPVIVTLKDLDDYEDAQLVRQKIAACYTVFVYDQVGAESFDDPTSALPERVEPGMVETLPAGKDVKFAEPPGVDGFDTTQRGYLRKVAAGIGLTYETLTGDLSQTNFSGGRMGWIQERANIEKWRWNMLIPMFCAPAWRAFVNAAGLAGHNVAGVSADWTAPRRELINPKEEVAATRDAIRSGQMSWSEAVREQGYDPERLAAEIKTDLERFDKLGIVLDCDPRKTTQQGQPRDKAPASAG